MYSPQIELLSESASLDKDLYKSHTRLVKTFNISEAKKNMGRVFARAKRGEVVLLRHGQDLMQLVPYAPPEPIPQRPVGYFELSEETIALINAQPDDEPPPL
jgi:antitoxin (DNA-binding transcriptional repressor) of toxin-antitoxin stability system